MEYRITKMKLLAFMIVSAATVLFSFDVSAHEASPKTKVPIGFVKNEGQVRNTAGRSLNDVLYTAFSDEGSYLFFKDKIMYLPLIKSEGKEQQKKNAKNPANAKAVLLQMLFENANENVIVTGEDISGAAFNYYTASHKHRVSAKMYGKIVYSNLYKGVDVVFYVKDGHCEYDFIVGAGAKPSDIRLKFVGQKSLKICSNGALDVGYNGGSWKHNAPYCFQSLRDGAKTAVKGQYVVNENDVKFSLGGYDASFPLTIDPTMVHTSYFGGTGDESIGKMKVDASGNVFIGGLVGSTSSFPVTNPGGGAYYQATYITGSYNDAYLAKFSSTGVLQWCTFFGDGNEGNSFDMDVSQVSGKVSVVGSTLTPGTFPLLDPGSGAYYVSTHSSLQSGYISEFNNSGVLLWSTYIGPNGYGGVGTVTYDPSDNIFVGVCGNASFPVVNPGGGAFNQTYTGTDILWFGKFNTSRSLVWGTFYSAGGFGAYPKNAACDASGNVVFTGQAKSGTVPTHNPGGGAYSQSFGGGILDAFVAKFDNSGVELWSTYMGGSGDDDITGCNIDASGNIFISGYTSSSDLPVLNAGGGAFYQSSRGGSQDALIQKYNASGVMVHSTYFGTTGSTAFYGAQVKNDNVYVVGQASGTIPVHNAFQTSSGGGANDAVIAKFDNNLVRQWSSYFGGTGYDAGYCIGTSNGIDIYFAGVTTTGSLALINNGAAYYDASFNGSTYDGFIAKLDASLKNALNFDGTNDAVDCGNPAVFQIGTGTIEAWVKTSGAGSGYRAIVVKQYAYGLFLDNNILIGYDWTTGTNLSTGVNLADGNWHHVAMSFNSGVASGTKIYIDGNLSLTTTWTVSNQTHALSIANGTDVSLGPMQNFAGTIDEVRIWNVTRTQSQIQTDMNCDIAQQAGLVAYYRFNQGTAAGSNTGLTCTYDYSGNSHSGTISNFALSGGTSNYVTGAVGNCNTATPLAPGTFSGNTPVCVGSTITLSNANTGGIWSTASGNVTVNSTSGVVTGVISGTTATVDYTLNCSTSSVTVTVNPAPAITSVSPLVGYPGSSVTIVGTSFDASTTNNIVYFGATRATVTAATTTTLTVTVPTGATFAPVTVETTGCGLIGYSQYPYLPSYNNSGLVANTVNFNSRFPLITTSSPRLLAIGDIDGDGKSDLVVANNGSANSVSVFRNISTSGSLSSGSFAAKVDFAVGGSPLGVAIADIDGDGKPEVLTANQTSNNFTVLRNTSTSGTINSGSFATAVNFTANAGPATVGVGDIDMDGKTDVIIANNSAGNVSVFRNTSSSGSISFAAKVDFTTGANSYHTPIIDIDGDGKPDMVVANAGANTISVFRNTSTPGTITTGSFAAKIDFSVSIPWGFATGDIDGDGKPDFVASKYGSAQIAVFRNTSSSGSVTFASEVAFTCGVNSQSVALGDIDGDGKLDVISAGSTLGRISVFRNTATSGTITSGSLAPKVDFSVIADPEGVSIGDLDGDGKADVVVADVGAGRLSVLRNNPLSPISGTTTVCAGATTTLSNATAGGTWVSGATGTATVNSTSGVVTGVAAGTATISYVGTAATVSADNIVTINVTVNSQPTVAAITGTTTLTVYNTTTLANATPSGVWTSAATGTATINSTSGVVSGVAEGIAQISYTVTNGFGCIAAATANVTVSGNNALNFDGTNDRLALPALGVVGAGSGLYTVEGWIRVSSYNGTSPGALIFGDERNGNSGILIGMDPTGHIWTYHPSVGIVSNSTVIPLNTWTHIALVQNSANVKLFINGSFVQNMLTAPNLHIETGEITYLGTFSANHSTFERFFNGSIDEFRVWNRALCGSEIVNNMAGRLSAGPTGLRAYYTFDQGIAAGSNTGLTTAIDNSGGGRNGTLVNYTLSGSTSNWVTGTVNATSVTFTSPTITASSNVTICNGSSTTLTVSGGTAYRWTPSTGLSVTTGSSVTASPSSTITYTVTDECGGTATVQVSVNSTPTTSGGSSIGICIGSSTSLTASGASTYTWAPSATLSASTGTSVTATPTVTTIYTVTGTNAVGCSSNAMVTVTVNPYSAVYSVTGGGLYCAGTAGSTIGLSGSDAGFNYQLYKGPSTIGSPVAGTGSAISFGPQTLTGTYTAVAIGVPSPGCTNNMTGSTFVSILTSPAAVSVLGGGSVCGGGPGVSIYLGGSAVGIDYQLYLGATPVGSPLGGVGTSLSFGTFTTLGTYTVTATNPLNGCSSNMLGSAVITAASGITAYAMTGGGSYCSGGTGAVIGLANSAVGLSYQLFLGSTAIGSAVIGTGSAISFGPQTLVGTYTVVGTNTSTGCFGNMTGSVTVSIDPLPNIYTVTGGGAYCAGGAGMLVGLSLSDAGVDYQLYNGASPVGSPVAGTGAAISFGAQTAAGMYTVIATDGTTTCTNTMGGSVAVVVNTLPTVTTGAGAVICAGSPAGLTASGAVDYSWSPATALTATTGSSVTANPTTTTTYTITGTDANGCVNTAMVTVTVNPIPTVSGGSSVAICNGTSTVLTASGALTYIWSPATALSATTGTSVTANPSTTTIYSVTGTGSNGCANTATVTVTVNAIPTVSGGSGVTICSGASTTLTGSGASTYTWSPATALSASTGVSVTASPTVTITYTVTGTDAIGCANTAVVTVSVNPTPNDYAITGGGSFCSSTSGTAIGLAGSDPGVNYQLYTAGLPVGSPVAGTGAAISFGLHTASGVYTVVATNAISGCAFNISGSTTLTSYTSPAPIAMTGGGAYCFGGTGVSVGLAGSATGVNYQLYLGGSPVGSPVAGIGMGFSFGLQTTAGTYTAVATNVISGCATNMAGTAVITVHSALSTHTVTGGGNYCSGGSGVAVGLNGSDLGVNYQLYRGGLPLVGTTLAGTGSALNFGSQTTAGVYTVVAIHATNGCTANMTGSATVTIDPLPTVYTVTGGGSYCTGGSGMAVGLSGSDAGIDYQLYLGGSPVGSPVSGTGSAISFGTQSTAGIYTVVATNTSTGCVNNMTGSATIAIYTLPPVYIVSGGGSYCSGPGLHIYLGGSGGGTNYQLFNGATPVGSPVAGTGAYIDFGAFTTPGTYTVVATNATTSCTISMSGSATITGISLPTAYNVTGGGSYCSGGTGMAVGLSNSDLGINYQLYRGATAVGSAVAGTGAAISFGLHTTAGTYTIVATNASLGCTSNMTGSAVIIVDPLPAPVTMTGGGAYCTGGSGLSIGLSGSAVGIDYQLYLGATPVGSAVTGSGTALNFGTHTTAGTYTAVATNTVTACASNMTGSAVVTINPLPTVYTVTGGGSYCSGSTGLAVGLSGSQAGVSYQLYNGAATVGSPVSGTGSAVTFGIQTAAGTYTVVATNASTGCVSNMTGSATITINALPTVYTVTGGGAYCVGSSGSTIGLSGSDAGIDYRLYNGSSAVGSPVAGTGSAISFGTYTVATTYTVTATNTVTGCSSNMSGSATITINSLPAPVSVTGGGTICIGGTGVAVGLAASASGISYQLYVDGTPVGSPVTGVGGSLSFGLQTAIGTYTATGTHPVTGCSNNMTGSVIISNYTPPTAFAVTGGGSYCSGGTGAVVSLAGSVTGVTYQLYRGATAIGSPVTGTGAALSFGLHTTAGTYTVVGTTTSNGCTGNMTGSAVISVNPLPSVYSVTGGGSYCSGGAGVSVGVSNSDLGTNYQLYNGATPVGSAVAGTGAAISFGLQTTAGTYTVAATITATSCTGNMTGSAVISIDPLPTAYTVTGGGSYCSGPGVHVYLSNSTAGVNYQLYRGATPVGSPIAGTGAALDFGGFTTLGTYTVVATNATTSCVNNMSGSAVISGFALPAIYTVTGGGGYCSGGTGAVVGLSNSDVSVDYQLYLGASPVGGTVAGTGSAISFGPQSTVGTYTVLAINSGSSCTSNMTGSATVSITALPTAYTVTGGGSYCLGGTGVAVGLSSSASGVNYQLYNGVTTMGSPVAGTGSAISFGLQTVVGTYTVVATDGTTTCTNNMTGSATISTVSLPTAYTVSGGGSYCAGGIGATISLSGSQTGVNYQLFNGVTSVGSPVAGTGSALSFGLHTSAGTYTVVATNTSTTCSATMTGSVAITTLALPTAYTITGGGGYCSGGSGVTLGLAGSDIGISYQLYLGTMAVGSALSGTGSALNFGTHTVGGTYTVLATNTVTGCTASIGSTTITVYALPGAATVSGGGAYCSGGTGATIWLPGSGVGVNYQLFLGATPVGSPAAGVGTYLGLGTHTTTGTYTVVATNVTTGCTNNMTGSATISIHAPLTTYTVTGGGSYCTGGTGVVVGLSGSATGVEYKAYRDGLPLIGSVSGTGSAISFGLQTTAGTYTVVATNTTTTCTLNMSGSAAVSVDALPTAFTVTGGGSYCTGGTGVAVGLSSSASGVNYQLYRGTTAVGSPVAGTGSAISFGLQTTAGTYTATATHATSGCFNTMSGSVSVGINSLPPAYTVTGGGSYCAGGTTGPNIYLSACSGLTTYQLWLGATPVGSPVAATGGSINFGSFTTVGTYSVTATSTLTGCTNNMTGSATISTIALPTVYTVTGGGSYCTGGTGVAVGLSSSNTGISYQLYRGATAIGAAVTGTGSALSFGVHTVAGTYTVVATVIGTFCTSNMSGSAVVAVNPLPTIFSVTGGGSYCSGGTGVAIGLSSSVSGTNYQLYRGATTVGSPVAGTGSSISFGLQTTAGTYTVVATTAATGCVSNMTGSATVSVNSLPTVYTVTGGGSYCTGGTGVLVGLSASQTWTSYQLFLGGSPVGSVVWGTGSAISFGLKTATGTYTVVATNSSSCTSNMTGSATVSVNPLPSDYTVTGGGSYCSGGTGVAVGLSNSQSGVNYQLYRSTSAVGSPVAGTGSAISFGLQTIAGTYTVKATSASTGCFLTMTGSATVTISAAPTVCSMTGGGSYCSGGTGVAVGLSASISGVTYQLYLSGSPVGSSLSGTGAGLSFGLQTTAGTYTAVATNGAGCTSNMSGTATLVVNALPTAYTVTGGGSYCSGGTGVNIGLSGSSSSAAYRVFLSGSPVTSYIYGTGGSLNFGKFTTAGTYTVQAVTLTTGCVATMTGSATVTINPIPTITSSFYTVAPGSTRTLTGTPSGGVWTTTVPSVATIGSSSGIVTGVALGSTYIYYTVSGCLGYRAFWVTPTGLREAAPDTTTSAAAVFKGGNIYIAPNPTRGMFMIRGSIDTANAPDAVTLDVTNMLGQVIHSGSITAKDGEINQEVQLPSSLANGMYIVTLRAGGESKVFHLVVER